MPPLLVALIAAGFVGLAYRGKRAAINPPASPTVAGVNSGEGILTGFAPPPIASEPSAPISTAIQKNSVSASASGVPQWSANAQEFNQGGAARATNDPFPPPYAPMQDVIFSFSRDPNASLPAFQNTIYGPSASYAVKNTPANVLDAYAAGVQSAGFDLFDSQQQQLFSHQTSESFTDPAAPMLPALRPRFVNGRAN